MIDSETERTSPQRGRWGELATQFLLVLAAALLYFLVRGATQGSVEQSEENAWSILRLERWMGLDLERGHRISSTPITC